MAFGSAARICSATVEMARAEGLKVGLLRPITLYPFPKKQLAEMGVKSYKGQHFGNSSIRQILGNITYTGNLLFQKEYVADPISKKSKINRGELPQYFVENTHEAIIPMEVYQAVQAEKARRRALGALANWSINTSCFTSKIKCGRCGKSYQRSNRKGRKDPDANYTIWILSLIHI